MHTATVESFLTQYEQSVSGNALLLRKLLFRLLPQITEQLDLSAKMIAYTYGQRYTDLICVVLPSKIGLKLGFNQGTALPDPQGILEGTATTTRYVLIAPPSN